jgi:hypothetical protein
LAGKPGEQTLERRLVSNVQCRGILPEHVEIASAQGINVRLEADLRRGTCVRTANCAMEARTPAISSVSLKTATPNPKPPGLPPNFLRAVRGRPLFSLLRSPFLVARSEVGGIARFRSGVVGSRVRSGAMRSFRGRCSTVSTEVAIIGAGPYGLSIAAYLRTRGIEWRVFGRAMDNWRTQMPAGRCGS